MTDIKETNQLINNASQEMAEIPFCGENILSIYDKQNEEAYVALRPLCKVLDLDFSSQRKKVLGNPSFYCGDITMVGADGKKRSMLCLSTKEIFGWMLTINPAKVNLQNRDKLIQFQRDSMDAVECYWKKRLRKNLTDMSRLEILDMARESEVKAIEFEKTIEIQKPIVEHAERILDSDSLMAISRIASQLYVSPQELNKFLKEQGVLKKIDGCWLVKQEYAPLGIARTATESYKRSSGKTNTKDWLKWTERGRKFVFELWYRVKKEVSKC